VREFRPAFLNREAGLPFRLCGSMWNSGDDRSAAADIQLSRKTIFPLLPIGVSSGSTAQLMISFYRHREKGMDKAQALWAAQLEVMNTINCTPTSIRVAYSLIGN
jgi:hypothetical protein